MPFIDVRANVPISQDQEEALKEGLGRAISLLPGKSEGSLMVQVADSCRLWFAGQKAPAALVNVMLYGTADPEACRRFSNEVIPFLEKELGLDTVYLKFEEVPNWFWN